MENFKPNNMNQTKFEQELFSKFNSLRKRGDAKEIAEKNKVSSVLIYKAFQNQQCSRRVLDMLIQFYLKRKESNPKIIQIL